jgi:hypothetical protein
MTIINKSNAYVQPFSTTSTQVNTDISLPNNLHTTGMGLDGSMDGMSTSHKPQTAERLSLWDGINTMGAGLVKSIPFLGQAVCLCSAAGDLGSLLFNKGGPVAKAETLMNLYQNLRGAFHMNPFETNPAAQTNWAQGQALIGASLLQKMGVPVDTSMAKVFAAGYGSQWAKGGLFNPDVQPSTQAQTAYQTTLPPFSVI